MWQMFSLSTGSDGVLVGEVVVGDCDGEVVGVPSPGGVYVLPPPTGGIGSPPIGGGMIRIGALESLSSCVGSGGLEHVVPSGSPPPPPLPFGVVVITSPG